MMLGAGGVTIEKFYVDPPTVEIYISSLLVFFLGKYVVLMEMVQPIQNENVFSVAQHIESAARFFTG